MECTLDPKTLVSDSETSNKKMRVEFVLNNSKIQMGLKGICNSNDKLTKDGEYYIGDDNVIIGMKRQFTKVVKGSRQRK